jgi:hypothetical protein
VLFKEGALLKGYLRARVAAFQERNTFYKILTMLKIIILNNDIFDMANVV